jgi:ferredoxin--NADP+ reductase
MSESFPKAVLLGRRDITDTMAAFRFRLAGGPPDFRAGQHLGLGIPTPGDPGVPTWRAYSIASSPAETSHVELLIRHADHPIEGLLTGALWALPVGGELLHRGVSGNFAVDSSLPSGEPDARCLLLLAAGTGLSPFLSVIRELAGKDEAREVVLCHGARHADELACRSELEALEASTRARAPGRFRFRYVPTVSRAEAGRSMGWTGERGRVEALLCTGAAGEHCRLQSILGTDLVPSAFSAMACGYPEMVTEVRENLAARGFHGHETPRSDGGSDFKHETHG